MVNVAVIHLRDIIKLMIKASIMITVLSFIYFYTNRMKQPNVNLEKEWFSFPKITSKYLLDSTLPCFLHNINKEKEEKNIFHLTQVLLDSQYKLLDNIIKNNPDLGIKDPNELTTEDIPELAKTNLPTQVVEENNVQSKYNSEYGSVKIKNETDYQLTEEMLTPNLAFHKKDILIFNTHTCESYTSSDKYSYEPTGNYRTTDLNYTVSRVGKELANNLKGYDFQVIQDITYHDYPAYTGSYTRSLETVQNILNQNSRDRYHI